MADIFKDNAPTATEKAQTIKAETSLALQNREKEVMVELTTDLDSLDWKKVKPNIMAQILTKIPYRAKKDEPPYYLTPIQALIFAMESYRMGLSPLSNQCFFNRDNNKVNATLEGKKAMARDQGYNFGPPKFEKLAKPMPKGKTIPGYTEDVGYKCTMEVKGFTDRAEYTAWLSEWYMPYSPVWKERTEHMIQTRAQEKCISSASGCGSSELPSVHDLEPPVADALPDITSTDFVEAKID